MRFNHFHFFQIHSFNKTVFTTLMLIASSQSIVCADTRSSHSTRIEVYSLSQNYWDTQYGDTLSEIVLHLLPNNPAKYEALKKDIVKLNPTAFVAGDAEKLLANKRLWMPGYMKQADTKVNPATTRVESFSWGNIKRPR